MTALRGKYQVNCISCLIDLHLKDCQAGPGLHQECQEGGGPAEHLHCGLHWQEAGQIQPVGQEEQGPDQEPQESAVNTREK